MASGLVPNTTTMFFMRRKLWWGIILWQLYYCYISLITILKGPRLALIQLFVGEL